MARGEGGAGPISVHNNKLWSLVLKWSMFKIGTQPLHNSDKPPRLMASINNSNKNNNKFDGNEINL